MALAHPEIVRDSAQSYVAYLDELIASGELHATGQQAAQSLLDSIRRALATDETMVVADVSFAADLLAGCDSNERTALVNQWSLGIGSDGATVIVMGTEHAYDVEQSHVGLALESCASSLLWLTDDGPELARQIAGDPSWVSNEGRAYHRHPSDHYQVGAGHTWRTVAHVLGVALSDLGERTYQVERSAHPTRESWAGATPTTKRQAFLERLLRAFRSSGQVLIVHGKTTTTGDDWEACNRALTMSFLDQESLAEPEVWHIGKAAIRCWTSEGRTVLHSWALNGATLARSGATGAYVDQLSELVRLGLHQ